MKLSLVYTLFTAAAVSSAQDFGALPDGHIPDAPAHGGPQPWMSRSSGFASHTTSASPTFTAPSQIERINSSSSAVESVESTEAETIAHPTGGPAVKPTSTHHDVQPMDIKPATGTELPSGMPSGGGPEALMMLKWIGVGPGANVKRGETPAATAHPTKAHDVKPMDIKPATGTELPSGMPSGGGPEALMMLKWIGVGPGAKRAEPEVPAATPSPTKAHDVKPMDIKPATGTELPSGMPSGGGPEALMMLKWIGVGPGANVKERAEAEAPAATPTPKEDIFLGMSPQAPKKTAATPAPQPTDAKIDPENPTESEAAPARPTGEGPDALRMIKGLGIGPGDGTHRLSPPRARSIPAEAAKPVDETDGMFLGMGPETHQKSSAAPAAPASTPQATEQPSQASQAASPVNSGHATGVGADAMKLMDTLGLGSKARNEGRATKGEEEEEAIDGLGNRLWKLPAGLAKAALEPHSNATSSSVTPTATEAPQKRATKGEEEEAAIDGLGNRLWKLPAGLAKAALEPHSNATMTSSATEMASASVTPMIVTSIDGQTQSEPFQTSGIIMVTSVNEAKPTADSSNFITSVRAKETPSV